MAVNNCTPQFTALGGFTLGYTLEDGIYREKFTPYINQRQKDILEARAESQAAARESREREKAAEWAAKRPRRS